jgi:hypothetical protein
MHSVNAFLFPCHFSSAALHRPERGQLTRGRNAALPVAIVLGGGYCPEIESIVDIHAATILLAAASRGES